MRKLIDKFKELKNIWQKIEGAINNLSNITSLSLNFDSITIYRESKEFTNEFKLLTNFFLKLTKIFELSLILDYNKIGDNGVKEL